jgi:hypothetical protein
MIDPQRPVGQDVSGNEESEIDGSLGSYESPSDPYPSVKRERSYGPQDEDYIPEKEVYEH